MTKMDRWTCPNDRNLQLRSKLNAGWSCHTKKSLKKDPQLSENELIEIQKVLQRSEILERNERSRVGRLVERLENMKRNASQSKPSPNCCAICGDFFSLVRSAQNQCSSCLKVLCSKCCIDTQYTSADDESWSSSATNSSSSTISFLTRTRRNSSYSASQKSVIYLCRLCSEQREFLKKSGAWFLKKYPNYLADTEKFSSTSNLSDSTLMNKNITPTSQSNTGSPSYLSATNNKNISESDSSFSFRFWKNKEGPLMSHINTVNTINASISNSNANNTSINCNNFNDNDTFSYISNETDLQQDANSNNDSLSITTRTASSENFVKSSPASINKKQDQFTFTNSPLIRNSNSNNTTVTTTSITNANNTSTTTTTSVNTTNKSSFKDSSNSASSKSFKSKNNVKLISSLSYESNEEDEKINPNMANYDYYSNIINNLEADSSNNNNNNKNIEINKNKYEKYSNGNKKSLSTEILNNIDTTDETSSLNKHTIKNINTNSKTNDSQTQQTKRTNLGSITNGLISSSLSASASNLDYDPEVSSSLNQSFKSLNIKKKKTTEWCSTQLSMDNDEVFSNISVKSSEKSKLSNESSKTHSIKTKGINLTSLISNKTSSSISSKIKLNPKASFKLGGNMDKLDNNLIVASTSSAVASASSLATSLNQLNQL